MPTLYCDSAVNDDWDTLGNWWQDEDCTVPATAIPTLDDDVVILGQGYCVQNNGDPAECKSLTVFGTLYVPEITAVEGAAVVSAGRLGDRWNSMTLIGRLTVSGEARALNVSTGSVDVVGSITVADNGMLAHPLSDSYYIYGDVSLSEASVWIIAKEPDEPWNWWQSVGAPNIYVYGSLSAADAAQVNAYNDIWINWAGLTSLTIEGDVNISDNCVAYFDNIIFYVYGSIFVSGTSNFSAATYGPWNSFISANVIEFRDNSLGFFQDFNCDIGEIILRDQSSAYSMGWSQSGYGQVIGVLKVYDRAAWGDQWGNWWGWFDRIELNGFSKLLQTSWNYLTVRGCPLVESGGGVTDERSVGVNGSSIMGVL